jgi:hypothetical protein
MHKEELQERKAEEDIPTRTRKPKVAGRHT